MRFYMESKSLINLYYNDYYIAFCIGFKIAGFWWSFLVWPGTVEIKCRFT